MPIHGFLVLATPRVSLKVLSTREKTPGGVGGTYQI